MKLTILGNNGPYPTAGGACSGYLIETKDTKILIDCGNGVLSNLKKVCPIDEIDAIFISHLHADHVSDIFIMRYAIGLNMDKTDKVSMPLYTPMDNENILQLMNYNESFNIMPIKEEQEIRVKGLIVTFKRTMHPVECYSIKVRCDNKSFVYSADTAYSQNIINFARDADVFLCEAGVLEKDRKKDTPHMSAKQAAEVATKANVTKLILTHFWPEYDLKEIKREALAESRVEFELSEIMKVYRV
ncbi:MBL fold metallo-hydrolase [Clostridiaceae bacterium M8S5]|nr:MBL fold metallo-hydrolase [Clostridiaceae bacterium M8S5]